MGHIFHFCLPGHVEVVVVPAGASSITVTNLLPPQEAQLSKFTDYTCDIPIDVWDMGYLCSRIGI